MAQILVIEDNDLQREFYADTLERAGYSVLEAPDGQIGMQLFHQQR